MAARISAAMRRKSALPLRRERAPLPDEDWTTVVPPATSSYRDSFTDLLIQSMKFKAILLNSAQYLSPYGVQFH
jgi:hypothetical protein